MILKQPKPELQVVEAKPTEAQPKQKKKHIGGYFSVDVYQQVKILCAEIGMTTQDMLAERLNTILRRHDKPAVA